MNQNWTTEYRLNEMKKRIGRAAELLESLDKFNSSVEKYEATPFKCSCMDWALHVKTGYLPFCKHMRACQDSEGMTLSYEIEEGKPASQHRTYFTALRAVKPIKPFMIYKSAR